MLVTTQLCKLCNTNPSKYKCPKCDIPYCSLDCYKGHSQKCTELFSRENVVDAMSSLKPTDDDKLKMFQMLQRVKERDEVEQEKNAFLDKLELLDLDDPNLFDKLTREEQQTFLQLISKGDVSQLIELWRPWWLNNPPNPNIEVLFGPEAIKTEEDEEDTKGIPLIEKEIPSFNSITTKEPSPYLIFNLFNILYAYVFILRSYNGDVYSDIISCVGLIQEVSNVLGEGRVHMSCKSAVFGAQQSLRKPTVLSSTPNPEEFSISSIDDLCQIVQSKSFILSALSDLLRIFRDAINFLSKNKVKGSSHFKKSLVLSEKKIYFYLVWTNDQNENLFKIFFTELQKIFEEESINRISKKNEKENFGEVKREEKGNKLITEV